MQLLYARSRLTYSCNDAHMECAQLLAQAIQAVKDQRECNRLIDGSSSLSCTQS